MGEAPETQKTTPHFLQYVSSEKKNNSEEIMFNFLSAVEDLGLIPYSAQEEAFLELMSDKHVILATPTGSGKSLVATAMHFKGFCEKKRSFYTCPIKALVSEKFFNLCEHFGAENVGMLTGDASINRDANIICCTAEILANFALAEGPQANINYIIMDEFHYYSDPERGVAWQLPLLCFPQANFLLMSATLGNTDEIKKSLEENTKKPVAEVLSMERPVPLDYNYSESPLHETLADLISSKKYPIYVVNFTQRECALEAQNAMSVNISSKQDKQKIDEAIAGFRFDTPFGKDIKRYIRHGVGIHHAGLLPKYRLLTEKLAQSGLLKIIMGTDTLGVGVNVPIRTVVFTKLCKFDGIKTRILSKRDFKQISGRAGRKGFDDAGSVIAQAPEHVIENLKAENRFSADDKKRRKKIVKKTPPTRNYVHFDNATFERLIVEPPEPLVSSFKITHSMILNSLASFQTNGNMGYANLIKIITLSHECEKNKSKHRKRCAQLFKSLVQANIINLVKNIKTGLRIVANENLQQDFSLHHTLSLYLIEILDTLQAEEENYALDILSLVESIQENPRAILNQQLEKKKSEAMAQMKADGLEYDARIEALEKIEIDKPLADFIYTTFNTFCDKHPWIEQENIHPKSIARAMFESGANFNEYIQEYNLSRCEGLLLRYLSQTYKILVQTIPDNFKTELVLDIIAYLRTILSRVDTSLIDEWESLTNPNLEQEAEKENNNQLELLSFDPRVNLKAFRAKVRAEIFQITKLLAQKKYDQVCELILNTEEFSWDSKKLEVSMEKFYQEFDHMISDPRARNPNLTQIKEVSSTKFNIIHTILDNQEDNSWFLDAHIDMLNKKDPNGSLIILRAISC